MKKALQGKYRAWDKRTGKMRKVQSVSFKSQHVTFKDKHAEKISFKDIDLLKHMGISSSNRKGIYEGDIVEFREGSETKIGLVVLTKKGEWFFYIVRTDQYISPWNIKNIKVLGNKFENDYYLSEDYIKHVRIWDIESVLSSDAICEHEYCRHDLEEAISKLTRLSKEELIDMIQSLSEKLRYYKKSYFEEHLRNRHNR